MAGFIKYMRTEEAEFLLSYPNANHLFQVMAFRARRADHPMNGLKAGQCFLGDFKNIGLTERQYRTAKKQLTEWGLATFKGTNKGTVATLVNSKVYDINEDISDRQVTDKGQASDGQATTNKECKNERMEEVKDLVGGERQPRDNFDFEKVKQAWNDACDASSVNSTKCRIIPEKAKKQLPKTYSKYCKVKKSTGHEPTEKQQWCVDYFKAVLDRAKTFAGQEGDHQSWKPNIEYATRVNTYDQVMEWIYDKRA